MSRTLLVALLGALGLLASAFAPATTTAVEAIPLSTATPDWYTADLHQQVLAAADDGEGVALPDGVEVPASALAFTGIRPGSWMLFPSGCTLNFVFGSVPDDGVLAAETAARSGNGNGGGKGGGRTSPKAAGDAYIGTAGHCTEVGDDVTIVAAPGVLMNIGTTVRSVDNGVGDDFALIDVRPEMEQHVNPSTAYFGGPTATGDPRFGDVVTHAGHGLVVGTGGTPRTGVVVYRGPGEGGNSDAFAWDGVAAPGDSGSFVLEADGTAAGDLTHIVVGGPYVPGNTAGTSIQRMLQIAGKPLATAPAVPDPTS